MLSQPAAVCNRTLCETYTEKASKIVQTKKFLGMQKFCLTMVFLVV